MAMYTFCCGHWDFSVPVSCLWLYPLCSICYFLFLHYRVCLWCLFFRYISCPLFTLLCPPVFSFPLLLCVFFSLIVTTLPLQRLRLPFPLETWIYQLCFLDFLLPVRKWCSVTFCLFLEHLGHFTYNYKMFTFFDMHHVYTTCIAHF